LTYSSCQKTHGVPHGAIDQRTHSLHLFPMGAVVGLAQLISRQPPYPARMTWRCHRWTARFSQTICATQLGQGSNASPHLIGNSSSGIDARSPSPRRLGPSWRSLRLRGC
jgi:hypothetical protein